MTAYQFAQPWLSELDGKQGNTAREFAHLRTYLQGIDSGTISLFNPFFLNATIGSLTLTNPLSVIYGGTGLSSAAQGDILYGSAANVLSLLNKNTTATRYLSNTGTSNNPAWAQVVLTDGVSGILPIANGGTNSSTGLNNNRIIISSGSKIVEQSALTNGRIILADSNGLPVSTGAGALNGNLSFVATSTQGVLGTTTNDSAASGNVGEYVSSTVSNQNMGTNSQWSDITSISLTAGDWDVSLVTNNYRNTATQAQFTLIEIGISTTTGNSGAGLSVGDNQVDFGNGTTGIEEIGLTIASYRMSLASTTTVYGKEFPIYSAGQLKIWARLSARRVR